MKNNNSDRSRLYEFRIRYNAGKEHSAFDNFHYYMAETASQAFSFHRRSMKKHGNFSQNLSVEKFNPYSERWENQTNEISLTDSKGCGLS